MLLEVASPADYPEAEAFSRSAGRDEVQSPLTAALIEWFIDRNPLGPGFLVTARDPESRTLLGYFLFYRWQICRGATPPEPCYLFVRLYVSPLQRRRKIFSAMTEFGMEITRLQGVKLAYTVPNQKSAQGFLKFGMSSQGRLPFWVRPSLPLWSLGAGFWQRRRNVRVERVSDFQSLPATLTTDRRSDHSTAASYPDRHLLEWRFLMRPDAQYEIRTFQVEFEASGILVTRGMTIKGLRALVVCFAWPGDAPSFAFHAALRDALRCGGYDLAIAFGGEADPGYTRMLRKSRFLICPAFLQPQPIEVIGASNSAEPGLSSLPATSAWHLMPLDWDVF